MPKVADLAIEQLRAEFAKPGSVVFGTTLMEVASQTPIGGAALAVMSVAYPLKERNDFHRRAVELAQEWVAEYGSEFELGDWVIGNLGEEAIVSRFNFREAKCLELVAWPLGEVTWRSARDLVKGDWGRVPPFQRVYRSGESAIFASGRLVRVVLADSFGVTFVDWHDDTPVEQRCSASDLRTRRCQDWIFGDMVRLGDMEATVTRLLPDDEIQLTYGNGDIVDLPLDDLRTAAKVGYRGTYYPECLQQTELSNDSSVEEELVHAVQSEIVLSPAEELEQCEQIIRQGITHFVEVGEALATIRDQRLWAEQYDSFQEYCLQVWDLGRASAYRFIDSFQVRENLSPIGDAMALPQSESQYRELKKLPAEQQLQAWQTAVEEHGDQPTARQVAEVASRYLPEPKPLAIENPAPEPLPTSEYPQAAPATARIPADFAESAQVLGLEPIYLAGRSVLEELVLLLGRADECLVITPELDYSVISVTRNCSLVVSSSRHLTVIYKGDKTLDFADAFGGLGAVLVPWEFIDLEISSAS